MSKIECPYRPRTLIWALYNEDFSDLTVAQIAEVFDTTPAYIRNAIIRIKRETGYIVPYKAAHVGLTKGQEIGPMSEEHKEKIRQARLRKE